MSTQLFQDIFEVTDLDPGGKKFDRVSRIVATSDNFDTQLILDVNTEIYPISIADKLSLLVLATPNLSENESSEFDYIMHGKVYKFEESSVNNKASVYVSFGGLLMCLSGAVRQVKEFNTGLNVYLLLRK